MNIVCSRHFIPAIRQRFRKIQFMKRLPSDGVIFRVNAGESIGLGHLQRCLSLGKALSRFCSGLVFVTNEDPSVHEIIKSQGFEIECFDESSWGSDEDLAFTLEVCRRKKWSTVVVDSYHIPPHYLAKLRAEGLFVAVIDDLALFPFPCQLVINGGFFAQSLPYESSAGDTEFLLGHTFALLRPEFFQLDLRTYNNVVKNIFVTLGGTDQHNLMPDLLRCIDQVRGEFSITCVIGPFFKNQNEIEAAAQNCHSKVNLVVNSKSLVDHMLAADLAVSSGGQTVYELLATGTPIVALEVAENQRTGLLALSAKEAIQLVAQVGEKEFFPKIQECLRGLIENRSQRQALGESGKKMDIGAGTVKVAEILQKMRLDS
jgi:UDP-2,4-diacetamido-2,4,6-trideoxy-beta-L-altropyranose hydrolase